MYRSHFNHLYCCHCDPVTNFLSHSHSHYRPSLVISVIAAAANFNAIISPHYRGNVRSSWSTPSECQSRSAGLMHGSRHGRRAANLNSPCRESTRPKDKPARHTTPAALIIQSGRFSQFHSGSVLFFFCCCFFKLQFELEGG